MRRRPHSRCSGGGAGPSIAAQRVRSGADARENAAQEGGGGRRLRRREATALRHAKAAGWARGAKVRRTRLRLADGGAQPDVAARSQALRLAAPLAALTQNEELGFAPPWPRRPRRRHARRTRRMRQEPPARPRAPGAAAVQAAATPRQAPGHPAEGLLPRILGARECGDRCRLQAAAWMPWKSRKEQSPTGWSSASMPASLESS